MWQVYCFDRFTKRYVPVPGFLPFETNSAAKRCAFLLCERFFEDVFIVLPV